ncbi:ammonium transporter [Roseococcus sp. SDR]|uniref:ammonium transporter n=1 Tax=Roseococcus sp. SDR TaxID=2835532 RepID=UPI001BCE34A3|nr:ammonium transporter [Roseococcus sp. SDR]MBS7790112.1 ammonium transporter [Roseococcus sp. SDR]MBV1845426.1 ammonium transporter [Roseococcus sp. SDR]
MKPWMRGALLAAPALALGALPALAADEPKLDAGNTAWMIVATCLVLMMTIPGVALFYAGMVRKKTVLATMMQSFFVAALIAVTWMVAGYSIAFGNGGLYFGDFSKIMFSGIEWNGPFILGKGLGGESEVATTIPETVFAMFQMTFAIITAALIFGAVADRMKFSAVCLFIVPWSLLIYSPIAHAVWHPSGLIWAWGALDFAGGTVVHINAGVAGLVAAIVLGKRVGYGHDNMSPHNLAFAMIGASLLWVGWFGFNAGSSLAADGRAGMAMLVTMVAAAMGTLTWVFAEWATKGKPSALGAISGAIAGLVAITPASGWVFPGAALVIGGASGVICFWAATALKKALGYDDSLDAFGVHGVGGIVGAILTGVFAYGMLYKTDDAEAALAYSGLLYGNPDMLWIQVKSVLVTIAYSAVGTFILLKIVDAMVGLRVSEEEEREGLDVTQHGERLG